ncbi:hypothetical protein I552_10100 [Mycobacterium xenopi 3993]|nr:hypothetical protein I552_10100 [Mycobacterium xenopi 3993]
MVYEPDGVDLRGPVLPSRAEVLAALSVAIDLGLGQPSEHMLRAALIGTRIADRLGSAGTSVTAPTTRTW